VTFLLAGLLIGVLLAGWFGFERYRQVYEQLIAAITAERDKALHEAKVYRGLLLPALSRVEAAAASEGAPGQQRDLGGSRAVPNASSQAAAKPASSRMRRLRVGSREFFNEMRRARNTPQIKTDALADAIEHVNAQQKVPTQEKPHV
jgi:hypothetical protein